MTDLPTLAFLSATSTFIALIVLGGLQLRLERGPRQWAYIIIALLVALVYIIFRSTGVLQTQRFLGPGQDAIVLSVTIVAVLFGIFLSALVEAGSVTALRWGQVLIPILASPLFIAPVWNMYTDLNTSSPEFRHFVTFFLSGTTNGFTWRSILDKLRKKGS
jgi:hypothetical protein